MSGNIYRITVKWTNYVQVGGETTWNYEVLYCGDDRLAARIEYHKSRPMDISPELHRAARLTIAELITDEGGSSFECDRPLVAGAI